MLRDELGIKDRRIAPQLRTAVLSVMQKLTPKDSLTVLIPDPHNEITHEAPDSGQRTRPRELFAE